MGSSFGILFIVLIIWSLFWKGLGLWHAARRSEKVWFIVLLLVNTLGILEIIYLFVIAKMSSQEVFGSAVTTSGTPGKNGSAGSMPTPKESKE